MRSTKLALVALGLCSDLLGACADETSDPETAQVVMSELVRAVDDSVTSYHEGKGSGKVNVKCDPGGTADVDGHVNVGLDPISVDVKVAVAFNACKTAKGNTLNGTVDFTQTVAAGQTPLRVETIYDGDVEVSGNVVAKCAVDVNVLVDEAGKSVKVSGTVCGNNVANLNLQLSPQWKH